MKKIIPYGKQYIDANDVKAVSSALKNDKITTGPLVKKFEYVIKSYTKSKFALSCNSGTSALYLAFQSLELKKNDIVVMPSINFVSSYNIAKIFQAKVYLADVDPFTGQMTPNDVINCCKKFKLKKIKILVTMYNGGYPQNSYLFKNFKKKFGCYIVEDACHALGAKYKINKKIYKIGSCAHSDISTFSFHPLKSITTGEGGALTTNSKKIYEKLVVLRTIGIKRSNNHWEYDINEFGLNFRLSDIQCALGISQFKKLNNFIKKRKKISNIYDTKLRDEKNIFIVNHKKNFNSAFHLYFLKFKNFDINKKNKLFKYMKKKGVILQYHYIPIYKFKIFKDKYIGKNAEKFYKNTITLPIYFTLKKQQQEYIINEIKNFFDK